jgi:hypothetical protein
LAELEDIRAAGFRQQPQGRSYEGKLFAVSLEDARFWGSQLYRPSGQPYAIVVAMVPQATMDQFVVIEADHRVAVAVELKQLAMVNDVAEIAVEE